MTNEIPEGAFEAQWVNVVKGVSDVLAVDYNSAISIIKDSDYYAKLTSGKDSDRVPHSDYYVIQITWGICEDIFKPGLEVD